MAEKVRVLHVITRLIRGGADQNTIFTVEGMAGSRWESEILAGAGSEVSGFSDRIRNCTRVLPELVRDPHPVKDLITLVKMVRIMKSGRYDIVHTHTAKGGFLGRIAARMAGVPHIVHTLHGVTFHDHIHPVVRKIYIAMEKVAARYVDVMISVGDDVKQKYLDEAIGHAEKYVTIHSGMETRPFDDALAAPADHRTELRREFGFAPEDVVVGMVSRLEPRKGYRYLFEAVERLTPDFPMLKVLVVGEGEQRSELENFVRNRNLTDRVTFAGFRSDVANVISAFDVAVLTSLWEGLPRVLVQYSLLEKPIVTFEVEGSREVIVDGRNGYVIPQKDVEALVDRLRRLVANPADRELFGRRSRERVAGRWDVELMVERIAHVYEDVEAGRPLSLETALID